MRIAVMQASALVLDVDANLAEVAAAADRARSAGADVLVTPELFLTGYAPAVIAPYLDAGLVSRIEQGAARIAARNGIALAYSVPIETPTGWRIGAVLLDRSGDELLRYGKVHLFGNEEQATFEPSTEAPRTVTFEGLRIGLLVCYDVEFPESVRMLAGNGADLVLVPTALAAGYGAVPEVLLRARALENQVGVAYANHSGAAPTSQGETLEFGGGSIIIGPDGRILGQAGQDAEVILADIEPAAVERARSDVPYLRDRRPDLYSSWAAAASPTSGSAQTAGQ